MVIPEHGHYNDPFCTVALHMSFETQRLRDKSEVPTIVLFPARGTCSADIRATIFSPAWVARSHGFSSASGSPSVASASSFRDPNQCCESDAERAIHSHIKVEEMLRWFGKAEHYCRRATSSYPASG